MKGNCGGKKMVERHSDPLWEDRLSSSAPLREARSMSSAAPGHSPEEASVGGSRPDLPLITQEAYMRERKGGKAEARCWFLKQPDALAPPSPSMWVAPL